MKKEQPDCEWRIIKHLAILVSALILVATYTLLFTGCKPRVLIQEHTRTEWRDRIEYRDRIIVDSVYNRDSVLIQTRGDTVFRQIIKWHERWRTKTDSIYLRDTIAISDSIQQPVLVPAELTAWQKIRLLTWWWIVLVSALYIVYRLRRI